MLETAVRELKREIDEHDGANVAGSTFAGRVDELISVFYDDIGAITTVSTRDLFDLFVIKVLYVERRSTDAGVVGYLGRLLERYLDARELFPADANERLSLTYLSDLLRETRRRGRFQNAFEAYRKYGDNSLFVTGVFPRALHRRRRGRWGAPVALVDRGYYVATGKQWLLLRDQGDSECHILRIRRCEKGRPCARSKVRLHSAEFVCGSKAGSGVQSPSEFWIRGLRSACAYVGASNLKELPKCTTFVRTTVQENRVYS